MPEEKKPSNRLKPKIGGQVFGVLNDLFSDDIMPDGAPNATFESDDTQVVAEFRMNVREATKGAGSDGFRDRWRRFGLVLYCQADFPRETAELNFLPNSTRRTGTVVVDDAPSVVKSGDRFALKLRFDEVTITQVLIWELDVEYAPSDMPMKFSIDEAELWFWPKTWD